MTIIVLNQAFFIPHKDAEKAGRDDDPYAG
jgi:hypothetical protein